MWDLGRGHKIPPLRENKIIRVFKISVRIKYFDPSGGSQPGLCPGCAAGASPVPLPGRTPPCPTSLANGHLSVLVVLPSLLPLHLCPML